MSFTIKCPNCSMDLTASQADIGKQGRCSRCGSEFTIGSVAAPTTAGIAAPAIGPPVVLSATELGAGHATAGLVLGLLGMLLASFVLSILGIVFGALGLKSTSRHGQAVAGLVMGCIGLPVALVAKFVSFGFCCFTL